MRNVDILIIGAGPAGMSTALHLARHGPAWAGRTVVLDKAVHPRPKLCGGGVSFFGARILENLGLAFEPRHVTVNEIHLVFQDTAYIVAEPSILRITRRDEFDHWLVKCGEQRGIEVRQGEAASEVRPDAEGIKVVTESDAYLAKALVVADGANSFVKRQLDWRGGPQKARLLEVLTPENAAGNRDFQEGIAVFDFSPMKRGVQGYYWDFPSFVDGKPTMNRGLYDSRVHPEMPRANLKDELALQLSRRGRALSDQPINGHPIHWFDASAQFSRPHTLLVGDAAGTDPLLGEGIPFSLAYGEAAAREIIQGWEKGDLSFSTYRTRILEHPLLKQLWPRASAARFLYALPKQPRLAGLLWKMAPLMFRALVTLKPHYLPIKRPRLMRR